MDRNRTRLVGLAVLLLCGHVGTLHASNARGDFATSASALIDSLQHVYASMNYERYCTLFTNRAVHGIDLRFFPYEEDCTAPKEWGYAEEMRIHRRMFRPETIGADEEPLPAELWVKSIHVRLELLRAFGERWDLYRSEQNPTGELDRHRWRAMDAVYATSVCWRLRQGGQLAIAGQARFVVVEDLSKSGDDPGRFLIHHWEDLGPGGEKLAKAGSP
jgi:hypothetical protein